MARDQATVGVARDSWVQLTNADVTAISFQVLSGRVYIRATTDETEPVTNTGWLYRAGEGELDIALLDLVNLSGADRVWAYAIDGDAQVQVDHA
jgi:hypothetical protein